MKRRLLSFIAFFAALLTSAVSCSTEARFSKQNPDWPTEAQVEQVKSRIDTFPRETFVSSVEWYKPLVEVKGSVSDAIERRSPDKARWQSAISVAEAHNSHALLVWHDGALYLEKYWNGFDEKSRFDTASMHKTVVALLTGIAVKDKLIPSIEDTIETFLPELTNTDREGLPIRSLLEMNSGIQSPPPSDSPAGSMWQSYLGDDLWQAVLRWPVKAEPYDVFYYANPNPQYLGWILERVANKPYAQYLSEALWQRIGARDARVWLDRENGSTRTSCCLQASAEDWLRIGQLILNEGEFGGEQIVPKQWIKDMTAATSTNPNYGWQIWRASPHLASRAYNPDTAFQVPAKQPFLASDTLFLDGSGGQRVYIIPSKNTIIVRIGEASNTWDDSELPNAVLKEIAVLNSQKNH